MSESVFCVKLEGALWPSERVFVSVGDRVFSVPVRVCFV